MGRSKKSASDDCNYPKGDLFESCSSEVFQTDDRSGEVMALSGEHDSFDPRLGDLFANPPESSEADDDSNSFNAAMQRQLAKQQQDQSAATALSSSSVSPSDSSSYSGKAVSQKARSKRKCKSVEAAMKGQSVAHENDGEIVSEPKKGRKTKSASMPPYDYPIDPIANVVCGIDEAGRGPLMGDVVAACVILDHNNMIPGLNDSKKLTEKARDELAPLIKEKAIAWGIGRASPAEIDQYNILNATYIAMRRAYDAMNKRCNLALVDGNRVPKTFADLGVVCETVVKGDSKVPEISAASILAKTARDADMYKLDKLHPEYGFAKHKGYPTADHMELLNHLPLLDCYRRSFGPIRRLLEDKHAL